MSVVVAGASVSNAAATGLQVPRLPPSPIRVVDLRCRPGQTDLNHATLAELRSALDVSEPIAQRVIDKRPHYGLEDLSVVEGIGPGRLRQIVSSTVCAMPITVDGLVPAIPDSACKPGQVDAALAPRESLVAKTAGLGLGGPVADRLLAQRAEHPFPTLEHLTIVEGIGDGVLKQWVKAGIVCLTPAPFLATSPSGDFYKGSLLARSRGETIALDAPAGRFALGTPAGVLDQPHAWATVVDVPDAEHRGPRADFKIQGAWQGGGDLVYLTLPRDPFSSGTVATVPAVMVDPGSPNAEFHLRSRLADTGDSWTIASEHLTTAESSSQFAMIVFYLPTDRSSFGDQAEAWGRENLTGLTASAPRCDPDITGASQVDVKAIPETLMTNQSALGRPIFLRCVGGRVADERVDFTFANASALAYRLPGDEGFPVVDMTRMSFTGDLLSQALSGIQGSLGPRPGYSSDTFVLPPTASVQGSLGFPFSINYQASYDPLNTSAYWATRNMGAVLGPVKAAALAASNCIGDVARENVSLHTLSDCAEGAGEQAAQAVSRLFTFLDSGHTLKDAIGAVGSRVGFSGAVDGDWHFHRDRPPSPAPPGGGSGSGTNPGGGPDGTILVDGGIGIPHDVGGHGTHSGTVYVAVDHSGVAYGMNLANALDYETYDCLARRYPMRSYLPPSKLAAYGHLQESIYPATCDASIPVRNIPTNATNFILREVTGTAWFIDGNSDLHWIPDGFTFICFAQAYYVLDHTPWEQIVRFQDPVYAGDVGCA